MNTLPHSHLRLVPPLCAGARFAGRSCADARRTLGGSCADARRTLGGSCSGVRSLALVPLAQPRASVRLRDGFGKPVVSVRRAQVQEAA
jgi:hypothetical protein